MKLSLPFRPTLVTVIVVVAVAGLFPVWQIGKCLLREQEIVYYMSRECHPVWRDLYAGRIRAGQSVEETIGRTSPKRVDRLDNFVVLGYQGGDGFISFTGVTIIARDGRLIDAEAWSCTWQKRFFREWTDSEERDFWKLYWQFREA